MGLKGKFTWFNSLHQGGRKAITFTLTCDNWLSSEVFDCAILDGKGEIPPQIRRQLKLPSGKSFIFNYDTCGWDWCQGDFFAVLGKNDKIKERWDLNLREYKRGECPDCHGTHKCMACNGNGIITDNRSHTIIKCRVCNGTGICQTCYIPKRGVDLASKMLPNAEKAKQAKSDMLRRQISELQSKIEDVEWEIRMMQLKDRDVSMSMVYRSKLELKYRYQRQLLGLQNELTQIESL